MSTHSFEGFVDGIDPRLLEFVSKVLKNQGCDSAMVIAEPVGKLTDNYGADVRRFIADKDGSTFKIIAKITQKYPTNGPSQAFHNEITMYTDVLPKVTKLEESAGVSEAERLKYAKHYGSLVEEFGEIILLEDLQVDDFNIMGRGTCLTDEMVKAILKSLAALHASSFVLKLQEPETFNLFKDKLVRIWEGMLQLENCLDDFQSLEDDMFQVITEHKYQNQLRGRVGRIPELINKAQLIDNESEFAVILHGDCWTNNVMFKTKNDLPTTCCMIDYQVSRVASPASDLVYMIFICTDHRTRMKYFFEWMNYYHKELEKHLSYHGLKAELIYPKDRLHADLKRYAPISLAQGVFCSTLNVRNDEDAYVIKQAIGSSDETELITNMTEAMKMTPLSKETKDKFKAKVEDIINSHLELGLL